MGQIERIGWEALLEEVLQEIKKSPDHWFVFGFGCDEPLSAIDFLVLPWRRTGVMLTVAPADGNRVQ